MRPAMRPALAHSAMMASSASRPSVSAAGPGCRISGDLISRRNPSRTAGIVSKPGRAATFFGTNFLPHHEPRMMSGLAAIDLLGGDDPLLRALAEGERAEHVVAAGDLDQLRHPADAGDHRLVPFLEIDARPARQTGGALPRLRQPLLQRAGELVGLGRGADQRAERADHIENAGDVALVERVHRDAAGGSIRRRCRPAGRRTSGPDRASARGFSARRR